MSLLLARDARIAYIVGWIVKAFHAKGDARRAVVLIGLEEPLATLLALFLRFL